MTRNRIRAAGVLCLAIPLAACSMFGRVLTASPTEQQSLKTQTAECRNFTKVATTQHDPMWCWAACAEMIHTYYGRKITQEEIVAQIMSATSAEDGNSQAAATNRQILLALHPDYQQEKARYTARLKQRGVNASLTIDAEQYISSQLEPYTVNTDAAIDSLRRRQPLIAALRDDRTSTLGHAYVMYGATYVERPPDARRDLNRELQGWFKDAASVVPYRYGLVSVELIDPYTGESVTMDAETFGARMDFMISRESARRALEDEYKSIGG